METFYDAIYDYNVSINNTKIFFALLILKIMVVLKFLIISFGVDTYNTCDYK